MLAKIQKWGNSLAVRIPKSFTEEAGLDSDSPVEIRVINGEIHIIPIREAHYELENLLAGVTDDNRHQEVDSGHAVGNEAW